GGPAVGAGMDHPFGLGVDASDNVFVTDLSGNRVRKISPSGIITTVAGDGSAGFSGDGGPATSAQMRAPAAVAADGAGNLFIADYNNGRVRKVSPDGIITTELTITTLGLTLDRAGNLFIADWLGNCVRKVSTS